LLQLSPNDLKLLERLDVPVPQLSFSELMQSLMSFRNEWVLHRRKCDLSGQAIISAYPEQTMFPVYRNELWWGDHWRPEKFAQPVNFSRPFFDQVADLQAIVPREGTSVFNCENSDYNSHIRESRNCYLNSLVYRCEDTFYSYWVVNDKDAADCLLVNNSTLVYDCMDCDTLYECVHLQDCNNCKDCHFSYQLRGCDSCIGCYNLVNKRFYVFNQAVTESEFKRLKGELLNGTRAGYETGRQIFSDIYAKAPRRALHNLNVENCLGDHLLNSRNCHYAFDGSDGEDVNYSVSFAKAKSVLACYSAGWPDCEDIYLSLVTRGSQNIAFSYYTFYSSGLRYCDSSMSCHDCFGSIGLRHARNCVLNRSYNVHEYEMVMRKLISFMTETGEWGKFFPPQLSTFPYNQSAAQQHFPLTPEETAKQGWCWRELESSEFDASTAPPSDLASLLPLDSRLLFRCEESGKPFKVNQAEATLYQRLGLPPPNLAPQARHLRRLRRRNSFQLQASKCALSGAEIVTTFDATSAGNVVSEAAFLESLQ